MKLQKSPQRFRPASGLGLRRHIVDFLQDTRTMASIFRLKAMARLPRLIALTYHRLAHPDDVQSSRFDHGVVDTSPAEFERQVSTLSRYFKIIGMEELLHGIERGSLPMNAAMITFDDGYRECVDVALPILKRLGLPATFFISTGFISKRQVYWWDRIAYTIHSATTDTIDLSYPYPIRITLDDRNRAIRFLHNVVKNVRKLDLERYLDELSEVCGVEWSQRIDRDFASKMVMSWSDVRKLRSEGMGVQSHTVSHRPLHTLGRGALMQELRGAREALESQLGESIHAISYPVGRRISHRKDLRRAVRDAGYRIGFSNASGFNRGVSALDPLDIRRFAIDPGVDLPQFRAMLAIPQLAHVSRHNA